DLDRKPTLALTAQRLGLSFSRIEHVDEEARLVALVASQLMSIVGTRGLHELPSARVESDVLRRGQTARDLVDAPGVYVMRDADDAAVYVGKARRLRSRMAAYVHRPLGPTRRLEGLASAVQSVDAHECQTDLEALVLEEREIG